MNRFGSNLQEVLDGHVGIIGTKSVMQIGILLTTLLEKLHSIGYVFNDLKPDNICVGNYTKDGHNEIADQHRLSLIDFGLATEYMETDPATGEQVHKAREYNTCFRGNFAFASHNALNLSSLSRRDDIISLLYLLYSLATNRIFGSPRHIERKAIL